jgi:hypothetical protein
LLIKPPTLKRPASKEEIEEAISDALGVSNIPIGAVDIIEGEWCFYQPVAGGMIEHVDDGSSDKLMPVYAVVVRTSGMLITFAAAGPAGIHARIAKNREGKILLDGASKGVH